MIDAAAAAVGVADSAIVEELTGQLDGKPWIPSITTHNSTPNSLARLARHLQASCYIVIAFLSGMRDSENGAELHLMQHSAGSK
ncbi:hypothetical protein AB0E04_43190 [Streptomyces sp. NPDC048251]|uniref:hypothetical protein n=1 Tax=Streptomyces sp. NPDC048251 TaxID=3154501 RepID=UPI00343C6B44